MGTFPTLRRNLGKTGQNVQMGLIKGFIVTPDGFSLSSSNKLSKTQWQNALFDTPSKRIHLLPKLNELKDNSEQIVIDKTALSAQFVRFGRKEFEATITKSFFIHQALQTYSGAVARCCIVDTNNYIWGQVDSAGVLSGYTVELFQSESLGMNDGQKPAQSKIVIAFADSTEIDQLGGWVNAQSFFGQLKELVDIDVAQVGSVSGTTLKLTATVTAENYNGVVGSSLDGLVAADFVIKPAGGGAARTVSACVQDLTLTPGVYSLTVTGLTAGDTATLAAPATLSIPGYESTGPITTV